MLDIWYRVHTTNLSGNLCHTEQKKLWIVSEQAPQRLTKTIFLPFLKCLIIKKKAMKHIFEAKSYFLSDLWVVGYVINTNLHIYYFSLKRRVQSARTSSRRTVNGKEVLSNQNTSFDFERYFPQSHPHYLLRVIHKPHGLPPLRNDFCYIGLML